MSKISALIQKYCPNGVEYKTLEEIGFTYSGLSGKSKKDFQDGNAQYVTYKNIFNNISVNMNELELVRISEKENQNNIEIGDILITGSSEVMEETGMTAVVTENIKEKIYLNSFCFGYRFNEEYRNKIDPNFMKNLFRTEELRKKISCCARGVTRYNLSKKDFLKISIPIPPLEVQVEIARVLENFIENLRNLSEELQLRQEQFKYYENKLIFNESYKKVKLEDLCTVNQGLQIPISKRKKEKGQNRYFYITVQFLKGGTEEYYIENPPTNVICTKDDILVTRTGSTGKIITGVEGCFHNNFFKVTPNDKVNKKYLYYVLNSKDMYNKMLSVASGGTVPDLPHKKFYNLEIPLPNIEEQKKIAEEIENMYMLCNDILEGIPAEIEARQKQYQFYRDILLNFKEIRK